MNPIPIPYLSWDFWSPRSAIAPRVGGTPGSIMRVESNGSAGCYGGFKLRFPSGKEGDNFIFSVKTRWKNLKHGFESLSAELDWVDTLGWTYLPKWELADGWLVLSNRVVNPGGASDLSVRLMLRWSPTGIVEWKDPRLVPAQPLEPRLIRLGAASPPRLPVPASVEETSRRLLGVSKQAGELGIQLLCLPELALSWDIARSPEEDLSSHAVTVPGPELEPFCKVAKEFAMAMCFSVLEREQELLYNTAVLIDESGEIAGRYRKVHLAPPSEPRSGITPGDEWVVAPIKSAHALVGMNICMDSSQEESARCVARLGAEICAMPIMGDYRATVHWEPVPHEFDLHRWKMIHQVRAMDNQFYLVVSRNEGIGSGVFAPDGTTAAIDDGNHPMVYADVDLNDLKRVAMTFKEKAWYTRREDTYGVLAGTLLPHINENW